MDDRAQRRRAGEQLLQEVGADLLALPGTTRQRMFGCEAVFTGGRVVAFADPDGALALKLPAPQAAALVEAGLATRVRIGRNPAREWVAVLPPSGPGDEAGVGRWRELLAAAHAYVAAG